MPGDNIVEGKFGKIRLSPGMIDKFEKEDRRLESILRERGFDGIHGWLDSNDFIGSREDALQKDLLDWGFFNLSSSEGYAWFLQKYFQ